VLKKVFRSIELDNAPALLQIDSVAFTISTTLDGPAAI
jgi:hypothetical protein